MNPVEHLARTLTEIGLAKPSELKGCSDEQIMALEARRNLKLPESYKTFLKAIGNGAGSFENDALWTYSTLEDAQSEADDMLYKNNIQLPNTIFAFDTGDSSFLFFDTAVADDPPVCLYESGDLSPRNLADSFSSWLTLHANELKDMYEKSLKRREEMAKAGIKPGIIHRPNSR